MTVPNIVIAGTILAMVAVPVRVAAQIQPSPEPQLRIEAGMHTALIKRIDLSADGKLLATGSDDKTVRLWSLPEGRLLRVLRVPIGPGDDGKIYAVAVSPDGATVAAGGRDATGPDGTSNYIYLFDAATGVVIRRLGPVPNVINDLAISSDGGSLAAGLWGRNGIRIWNMRSGELLARDWDYDDAVYGVAFDRSGRLATSSYDGSLRLYDAHHNLQKKVRAPGGVNPYKIAFSPDGDRIALGYLDAANIDIFSGRDLTYAYSARTTSMANGHLGSVAWLSGGQLLFAAGHHRLLSSPILRWNDGGHGEPASLVAANDTVTDLKPWARRGIAYAAADPAFGVLDTDGHRVFHHGPVTADMRRKLGEDFQLSADARRVRFGMKFGGEDPWLFDVSTQNLAPAPAAAADLRQADITSLPVTGWEDTDRPKLGDRSLTLQPHEPAHSLAIMPDRRALILGANFSLRCFDASGEQVWEKPVPGAVFGVNLSADGRIIVTAHGDGTIRWHRSSDGRELLALFVSVPHEDAGPRRWVLWTPKGYYTASPGGEDLLGWHVNRGPDRAADFFPAPRFRDQFYRPDIVQAVLETLDEEQAIERANAAAKRTKDEEILARRPPVLTLISPKEGATFVDQMMTIDYTVRSPSGQPIGRVRALLDGVPVDDQGAKGLQPVAAADRDVQGSLKIKLPPRDVTLSLVAETAIGESQPVVVNLKWSGPAPSLAEIEKPKLYALVVGVSNYRQNYLRLKYAAKDATDFAEVLKLQKGGLYRDVSVKVLVDGEATERRIRIELERIKRTMTSNDAALFFFSGHGTTLPDQSTYLVTFDVDPEIINATALNERMLVDELKRFPGKTLIFLDACQSAGGLEGFHLKGIKQIDVAGVVNDFLKTAPGLVSFVSSLPSQLSAEREDLRNGIFTAALLEGLAGKADYDRDGVIQTVELDHWLTERVKQLSNGYQDAVMSKPETMKHFPVAAVVQ